MKQGMDRSSGRLISGIPYLWQRLSDVISTPRGSVVGRRDFGSELFEMIDRNVDSGFYMEAYVRLAEAINSPSNGLEDFRLTTMRVEQVGEHHVDIYLAGVLLDGDTSSPVELEGIRL